MRQKILSMATAVAVAVSLAGCSMNATMIPVEGPLAALAPVPNLTVHVDGLASNHGKLSFVSPDGDACAGRWVSLQTGTSAALIQQYGATYMTGVAVVQPGQNGGQALATCPKGRTYQLEFVTNAGTAHGSGIGKDNQGNVYRFVF